MNGAVFSQSVTHSFHKSHTFGTTPETRHQEWFCNCDAQSSHGVIGLL